MLDFASSGRSGRRNALPDILGSPAGVSPTDLPLKLAQLSVTGMEPTQCIYLSLSCQGFGSLSLTLCVVVILSVLLE